MEYPKKPRGILRDMPHTLLIQAFAKVGKSTIASKFTTDFAPGESVVINMGNETGYDNLEVVEIKADKASKFESLLDNLIVDQPYKFVFFDNLSVFDRWSETLGTLEYMSSTMGKSFNFKARLDNPQAKGPGFKKAPHLYFVPTDKEFQSVHILPDGNGYRWSRQVGWRLFTKMKQVAPHVIFIGHIKIDRYTKDDSGRVTNSEFLDVTGGLGRAICKDIDALCTMSRKRDEGFLSFKTGSNDLSAGCRYDYLENQTFKISEKTDSGIQTFWEEIFPNYKTTNERVRTQEAVAS